VDTALIAKSDSVATMERSESTKSVEPAAGGAYKNMIYVFIARDADMIVYEYHAEKRLN